MLLLLYPSSRPPMPAASTSVYTWRRTRFSSARLAAAGLAFGAGRGGPRAPCARRTSCCRRRRRRRRAAAAARCRSGRRGPAACRWPALKSCGAPASRRWGAAARPRRRARPFRTPPRAAARGRRAARPAARALRLPKTCEGRVRMTPRQHVRTFNALRRSPPPPRLRSGLHVRNCGMKRRSSAAAASQAQGAGGRRRCCRGRGRCAARTAAAAPALARRARPGRVRLLLPALRRGAGAQRRAGQRAGPGSSCGAVCCACACAAALRALG
jgi:hypothetical protein